MKLKLKSLSIKDFAGIKNESFNFDGKDAKIYGDNATGKTTTAIALNWLLFDKGLEGQKIDIVPKDENNDHIHELVPTVEAVFDMDDNALTLKRESHPNYEKVEGSTKKHYKNSRSTKQYIDEVPFPITKYKAEINKIIDEEVFKLVTNPDAFPQLHWQDKRKMLFEIAGDVSDEDVINSNSELKDLLEVINRREIEDEKKVVNEQLKKAREDLEHIPVKINTLNEQLSDDELDEPLIDKTINQINEEIELLKDKRTQIEHGGAVIEIKREIDEIQYKMDNLKREVETGAQDKVNGLQRELESLESDVSIYESRQNRTFEDIKDLTARKDSKLKEYKELATERDNVQADQFEVNEDESICSHCGQPLPEHDAEKSVEHAQAEFNKRKSNKLESINAEMERVVEAGKSLGSAIKHNESEVEEFKKKIADKEKEISLLSVRLDKAKTSIVKVELNSEYKTLQKEKTALESKLGDEKQTTESKVADLTQQITVKQGELDKVQEQKASVKHQQQLKQSIDDYRKEEESILDTIEDLKYRKHLIDQFTKTKVNLITEKVNSMFDLARFKLFHTQVNGDIKETCEIMVDGVTYDGGLNNAMRINAGLDIIGVLSKHFEVEAPCFVDNSEAVTQLKEIPSQQIQLIVSEPDKKLRLEVNQ
ncbi:AAA family ATPase [Lacicoccus qingdaonensis]|uniref:Rad50/SbcC-type AAA domain-containing protein n=1 Tax=Lacicoccus qingdaonensis TaxID=576118 RepID=A0A1G9F062_9BACL|nr:hypothetical protein [Salinicoccus qingdaonensis]SDK81645.1 hypothetical protein SAMN05216216_11065 [Salinicoccus qingdaonensis]